MRVCFAHPIPRFGFCRHALSNIPDRSRTDARGHAGDIELANFIVRLQDIDLYNSAVALVEMKTLRPYDRLGRLLWDLAAVIGNRRADRSTHLILPLSDKEIAQLLGFSVVHMKRSRAQLEAMRRLRREGSRGIVLFEH